MLKWVLQAPAWCSRTAPARIFGPTSALQEFSKVGFINGGPPCRRRPGVTRVARPGKCPGLNSFMHDVVALLQQSPINCMAQAACHGRSFLRGDDLAV